MEAHHATLLEAIADAIPDVPVLAQGDRIVRWGEMDERAARLTGLLAASGLSTQSRVAINMFNCNEWLESWYGVVKGRFVPVSINYRYLDDELAYLFDNSDSEALIFHASLGERVIRVAKRIPAIKVLIQVDDIGGAELPDGVYDYEKVVTSHAPAARMSRSPDDITMWYSGGTTGLPKGVIMPIGNTATALGSQEARLRSLARFDAAPDSIPADLVEGAVLFNEEGTRPISIPAAPLMHSTALSYSGPAILYCGGMVVTMAIHSFDAHELWTAVDRHRVTNMTIVGDAFGMPMARALEQGSAQGTPYDGSSMRVIMSAGAAWSGEVKKKLFEHMPQVLLVDNCGSSEGAWFGTSISRKGDSVSATTFMPAPGVLILDEKGEPMPAGTGKPGLLASLTGNAGYHKDPEKTKQNFRFINGLWYTTPGDLGLFNADGTMVLLGRGSSVINTGGEKVYPEEVDDTIKMLPDIDDCLVVGTPNERFGQQVTAVVQLRVGASVTADEITAHVRQHLATYKAPRAVVFVEKVPRLPNGKPDYPNTKAVAEKGVAATAR